MKMGFVEKIGFNGVKVLSGFVVSIPVLAFTYPFGWLVQTVVLGVICWFLYSLIDLIGERLKGKPLFHQGEDHLRAYHVLPFNPPERRCES